MARYGFPAKKKSIGEKPIDTRLLPAHLCLTTLETDFPRLMETIQTLWGFQELNVYFDKLAMDDRGDRAGFPKDVWEDLHMLHHLHLTNFPEKHF